MKICIPKWANKNEENESVLVKYFTNEYVNKHEQA